MNFYIKHLDRRRTVMAKTLLIMKLIVVIMTTFFVQVYASGFAQKVTLKERNTSLNVVIQKLRSQTNYDFLFDSELLANANKVTINIKNIDLEDALGLLFNNQELKYSIKDKFVVIEKKEASFIKRLVDAFNTIDVRGSIVDAEGKPLSGASIRVKGSKKSTTSDLAGNFLLKGVDENATLEIVFIGYQSRELKALKNLGIIEMELSDLKLDEVVINTGIVQRKKESFTGAVATFTGAELKQIGNGNILQSLKTLDPSFIIITNNTTGSNPNRLPEIQIRGKTSLTTNGVKDQYATDPNMPLFILNGMESSLQQIVNLDMNRVASITLLKDAASTALYGSKAANGVVVVETIRPRPGELRVNYTVDLRLEAPDLNGYNMMDAAENLEFQRQAGLYTVADTNSTGPYIENANLYNSRLAAVKKGVNSYWLAAPLRTALTAAHSLNISGGSDEFQYDVGLNYRNQPGVMKGSNNSTWGGSVDLYYRKNKLNVSNRTYISNSNGNESPFGSFSTYVNKNPYYKMKNEDGSINYNRYLETYHINDGYNPAPDFKTINISNPLYNASLNSKNSATTFSVQNILNLIWDINADWRISTGLLLRKQSNTNIAFTPSADTRFDQTDVYNKGTYSYTQGNLWGYQGNAMLTFNKVLREKHALTGNLRVEANERNPISTGYSAVGFPDGVAPNPAFAYGYTPSGKPLYSKIKTRQVSALGSFNYSYDRRYYADATYRTDGSTVFGSAKKYSPFWSVGLGWNINNEGFLKDASWLGLLKIRGNTGTSGNQELGTFVSSSVYRFENDINGFGQGFYLSQLGNPNLEWQKTKQTSIGIDAAMFNNRFSLTVNAYHKITDPLITSAAAPTSTGVSSYALNVGNLSTKGVELIARYAPIFKPDQHIAWTLGVTGSFYKSKYAGFGNLLKNANDRAIAVSSNKDYVALVANYLQRYLDGYSPDDVWAVKSLGIDPATGKELYLKKDGSHTFIYNPNDAVAVGNGQPRLQGVLSSNLSLKGFTFGINIRYSLGQSVLNTALYDKVENISDADLQNNQDKRALESRWKVPGDVAQFKGISIGTYTPPSSRFIQKENFFSGESINLGYEFRSSSYTWVKNLKMSSLRINGYMNDIFRVSNIKAERGIDYPFSNVVSFSLSAMF